MDDVSLLSRLQFAVAVFFHFIFVPLTLGLSLLVALMETRYVRTGDEVWRKHAKFWGKLFIINFTLGVVTGITLEFQFGTNWARYSEYVGDIFGSLLAIEGITSPDGRILGKMGHSERRGDGLYENVAGDKFQPIFEGGVDYFRI